MARIELIGAPQSTYTRAARMALEEKGVPYDLRSAPPHSPEVNAIHPFGKIPVMKHGDFELCESMAIAAYVDRAFPGPKLIPEDARAAAKAIQWLSIVNTMMDSVWIRDYLFAYLFPDGKDAKPDRARIDKAATMMRTQAEMLDKALAGGKNLTGDAFTFADINLMPILFYVQMFPEGAAVVAGAPNLKAFYARNATRPSFTATIPPPPKQ
jgi:glutathione S-transferase